MTNPPIEELAEQLGIPPAQVQGFITACDELNKGSLKGSGITAVPFWFVTQYTAMAEQHKAMVAQLERVTKAYNQATAEAGSDKPVALTKKASNIITGIQDVYIPGQTGPRIGDEHLDMERIHKPAGKVRH